jgi:ABC-type dipeptide/oligopeptide/nickel transport system permease component
VRTYLVKRLLLIVPTLFGVAAVVFLIMRVIPGDVTLLILGGDQTGRIDPQQLAAMRHQLGLDQPLAVQFGAWLWGVLRLDFGTSLWTGQPVIEEVLIRLPLSLEVAILATIVSVLLAIPLGMLAAVRQDTWVDYVIRVVSIGGIIGVITSIDDEETQLDVGDGVTITFLRQAISRKIDPTEVPIPDDDESGTQEPVDELPEADS